MTQPHLDPRVLWECWFPDFARSTDAGIQRLIANANLITLTAKTAVASPGSACNHFPLIASGKVCVRIPTESGRSVVLYHVTEGESCILTTSCLLSDEQFPAESITETDCTVFMVGKLEFNQVLRQSPLFQQFVFRQFGERLAAVIRGMERIVAPDIDRDLARALLKLQSDQTITHEGLASELTISRETVSRHLKKFESSGWVRLRRCHIDIVEPDALTTIAAVPPPPRVADNTPATP